MCALVYILTVIESDDSLHIYYLDSVKYKACMGALQNWKRYNHALITIRSIIMLDVNDDYLPISLQTHYYFSPIGGAYYLSTRFTHQ